MFSLSMRHHQKREEAEKKRQKEKVRKGDWPAFFNKYFQEQQKKMDRENQKTENEEAK